MGNSAKLRVRFNGCYVRPETLKLLKALARHLERSQGQTIDRAVQALAVAESFGGNHLNLSRPIKPPRGVREKR